MPVRRIHVSSSAVCTRGRTPAEPCASTRIASTSPSSSCNPARLRGPDDDVPELALADRPDEHVVPGDQPRECRHLAHEADLVGTHRDDDSASLAHDLLQRLRERFAFERVAAHGEQLLELVDDDQEPARVGICICVRERGAEICVRCCSGLGQHDTPPVAARQRTFRERGQEPGADE